MKIAPLRTITQEEITTYQRDGVVWLREIIEPEWALGMGRAIDAAIGCEHGFVLNLTNFGEEADNQANVDRADDHFHRIIEALKEEVVGHWDDPIYHRGTVLIDEQVGSVEYLRGSHRDGTIYKCSYFISDLAAEQDPGVAVPDIEADKSAYNLWHCRESWLK